MSRRRMYQSNIHDLFYSLIHGTLSALEKYISNGGSLKIAGPEKKSLLIGCIEERLEDRAINLLELGADVNFADENGMTPLMCAAQLGLKDCMEHLLTYGAEVDKTDKEGRTALMYGVMNGHINIVNVLLKSNCDVDMAEENGFTALHLASENNDLDCVRLLISHNCDPVLRTGNGHSVFSLAIANKNFKTMTMVLEHYGSMCEGSVFTADLFIAQNRGYSDAVILLLSHGVDPFPNEDASLFRHVMTDVSSRRLRTALISEYGYITSPGKDNNLLRHIYKKHLFIQCFPLLKLLFKYGLQTDQADQTLTCKEKCLCRKVVQDSQTAAGHRRPGTLVMTCRTTIRRCLGLGVVQKAMTLPLPNKMKRYICLSGEFCLEKALI